MPGPPKQAPPPKSSIHIHTHLNDTDNSTLSGPSFCTRLAIPLTRFATPGWPPSPALWLELPGQLLHQTVFYSSPLLFFILLLLYPLLLLHPHRSLRPSLIPRSRICRIVIVLCRIWFAAAVCVVACISGFPTRSKLPRTGLIVSLLCLSPFFPSRGASFASPARPRLTTHLSIYHRSLHSLRITHRSTLNSQP